MTDHMGDVCPTKTAPKVDRAAIIQRLNDAFRKSGAGGYVAVTPGIKALGIEIIAELAELIRCYDAFDSGNDPYGEHDMGVINHAGSRVFWKIDYYDSELDYGSPDPTDPAVTTRVMTIMLASEY